MLVNTDRMIPVAKLQRELTKRLREITKTEEPLYVLRNNEIGYVILPAHKYEIFRQVDELLEHDEIAELIEKRLKGHDRAKNVSWDDMKKQYDL
jgi:PHD/YefM family antitoxin component YafN of YafNO toxin-antitoxin module